MNKENLFYEKISIFVKKDKILPDACEKIIDYSSNDRYIGINYRFFRNYSRNRTIIYKDKIQNHKVKIYN